MDYEKRAVQIVPAPRKVSAPAEPAEKSPMLPLTTALIALNVLVFVGQLWMDGLHGLSDMSTRTVLAFGANFANATRYEDRIETLLTSCFVHGSLLHIAFNMVALRQVGTFVERAAGAARMFPLYLIAGVVGSAASMFTGVFSGVPHISVGASGAVCGLIGAALVLGYRIEGRDSPIMKAMAKWLASLFALGFTVTFVFHALGGKGGFDNSAHVGGALAGAVTAALWRRGVATPTANKVAILGFCAAVTVATALRVYVTDTNPSRYPFAMMSADERLAYATQALDDGRCDRAGLAIRSLENMKIAAPEVLLAERNYHAMCR